jgi:egghead protein (zeste-white 4 protein)
VCKAGVESSITFDNGMAGSIAEDTYFASAAIARHYTFDWIEGEMREQSPHTFIDFVKQRRRWLQGIYLVVHDPNLSLHSRFWFAFSLYNWIALPFQLFNTCVFIAYPSVTWPILDFLFKLNATILLYLFIIGSVKSFQFKGKRTWLKRVLCTLATVATIPVVVGAETIAVFWGLFTDKKQFYIVNKNHSPSYNV